MSNNLTALPHISYDQDLYAWTQEQANLLKTGQYLTLDIEHLIEEIEDLGKREKRSLASRFAVLIGHLLKWRYQFDYPNKKSWRATINTQRRAIEKLLQDNPSLKPLTDDFVADAYPDALDLAVAETPLDYADFPETCPWQANKILSDFLPEE